MIPGIVASYLSGELAGAIGDPFFDQVVASLHMDGTDGSTTFTDVKGHTFTASGNAQIDTAQSKFGGSSLLLDGTDDYISAPDHADWAFGSGDWTVECWVRFNGDPGTGLMTFVSHYNATGNQRGWAIGLNNNTLRLLYSTTGSDTPVLSAAWNPATAIWYHVRVVRFGANVYFFVDGLLLGSSSIGATTAIFDSSAPLQIGTQGLGADGDVNGWIDDVRITRAARSTKSFSRPVRANYDNLGIPSDELYARAMSILHMEEDFGDGKSVSWTPAGNTFIDSSQSMFGIASARLDGTGDWIDATDTDFAWGTADFTIECWVRHNAFSGNNFVFTFGGGWGPYRLSSDGTWGVFDGVSTNPITTAVAAVTGQWTHVALCRRGTTLRLFINGTLAGSATNSTNFTNQAVRIGAQPSGSGTMNGWVQDFRASNFARYVGDFQPPLRRHPDSEGDPFFDDVVALNHWEGTNGSTTYVDQVAGRTWTNGAGAVALQTADFKYGAASLKFPGTSGNRVDSNTDGTSLAFGLDDFTIEMWFKIGTVATTMLWDQRTALSQPRPCIFQQSGSLLYYVNNAVRITGSTLTNATWQHVALCRRAGSTKLFIDGVQVGATYTDATDYTEGRIRLGTAGDSPGFGDHAGAYDDIRVTKGTARYPSNFSPPPAAFEDAA